MDTDTQTVSTQITELIDEFLIEHMSQSIVTMGDVTDLALDIRLLIGQLESTDN